MICGILGRKVGMTRIFDAGGVAIPVTVIEAGPCPVIQVRKEDLEGYTAIQLGFGATRKNQINKPLSGHFAKVNVEPKRFLKEIQLKKLPEKLEAGQEIKVDIFKAGEKVDVIGNSIGKGFQGTVKRHHFSGGPKTHGQSDRHRAPGSIGGSSWPSHTWKGQRMAGRMGGGKTTLRNIEVISVDTENNILLLKGSVPGKKNTLLTIKKVED